MNKEQLHQLLLRSFDEVLTAKEQQLLALALQKDSELRQLQAQYQQNEATLQAYPISAESPPYLVSNIMRAIKKEQTTEQDFFAGICLLFPKIALPSLALIAVLLLNVYFTEGSLDMNTLLGIHNLTEDDAAYLFQF